MCDSENNLEVINCGNYHRIIGHLPAGGLVRSRAMSIGDPALAPALAMRGKRGLAETAVRADSIRISLIKGSFLQPFNCRFFFNKHSDV
jgi:hypothetical protein